MVTWVDRIAQRQTDIQKELEKLRKKYETEEQPPEEFPKGFRESDFTKFESLFPEFREVEKTRRPEISPEMAFKPYAQEPISPVSGRVTTPYSPELAGRVSRDIKIEQEEQAKQEAVRKGESHYWWGPEKSWKSVEKPREVPLTRMPRPVEALGELPPFKQIGEVLASPESQKVQEALSLVGLAGAVALTGFAGATVGWQLFLRMSISRNISSWARSANVIIPKETRANFIEMAMKQLNRKWLSKQAIKTIFKPTKTGLKIPVETATQAEQEVVNLVNSRLPTLVPRGTQTGALAFGGKVRPPSGIPPAVPPKPEITPAVPEVKQPWQMTNNEYMTNKIAPSYPDASKEELRRIVSGIPDRLKETEHKAILQQALSEGKPVPAEVLAEYPDLKPPAVERRAVPRPPFEKQLEGFLSVAMGMPEKLGMPKAVPEVRQITEGIDKLTGVEKTYWDSANKKLTIYYNPDTTMERARIEVAQYLTSRQLQASVEKTTFISVEKGEFKPPAVGAVRPPTVPPEAPRAITEGVKPPTRAVAPEAEVTRPPVGPPAPPAGEIVPPRPAEDPIIKLTRLIRAAKPVRKETELLKHEELRRRAGALAGALRAGEGREAFLRAKGVLKGELPQAVFEPPEQKMTPDDITGLFNTITDSDLLPFQKLNTGEALSAILGGKLPTRGDIALLESMFGSDLAKVLLSHRPLSQKAWDAFLEVWNIPRTLMASGELSASLRQGALLASSHPRIWAKTMWAQLRAAAKEKNAIAIDRAMQTNPGAELRDQYKVFHAPISGVSSKLTEREEVFISNFFERFVGWWEKEGLVTRVGTSPLYLISKGVRISERAYVTFLNKMRADIFDTTVATWRKTGDPPMPEELTRLANFVNNGTGRGTLGKLEESAPALSGALFSPRLQASRIGFFWDAMKDTVRAVNDLAQGRPVNRMSKENLKAVAAFVGTGLMILGLLKLNGWEVSTNPNSADFGKAKKGKTRIDIWSSFQPYARFISNMITSARTSTITGATLVASRMKILKSFVRSKLMPSMGYIWDILEGRTYGGEDIELSVEQTIERLAPMWWQDMYEAIEAEGLAGGFRALPGFLGVGIQTYDLPSWPELEEYFFIEDTVNAKGYVTETATKKRLEYRIKNPENEAKLFVLGRFTTLKTPAAKAHVLRIMEEHKIKPKDVRGYENVFGTEKPAVGEIPTEPPQIPDSIRKIPVPFRR